MSGPVLAVLGASGRRVQVTRAERPGAAVLCLTLALLATVMLSIAAVAHARTSLPLSRVRALAEQGNQRAELQLGFYYDQGKGGLPQDPRLAVSWIKKSAEQGDRRAEFALGVYYYNGKGGLPQDPRLAVSWIKKSAEQGYRVAEYDLGFYYDHGKAGLPQDPRLAAKWYMKSAEQGYRVAEYDLGFCYQRGKGGLPQDPRLAVKWYMKSAEQGYRRAEYDLGFYYYYGKGGLPQDPRLAVSWIKKSAAQNWPSAINVLRALENAHAQTRTTVAHARALTVSPPATSVMPAAAAPLATTGNQQRDQSLRSFWQAYFQHSNAKLVDFGTPALVQPVSFAGPP